MATGVDQRYQELDTLPRAITLLHTAHIRLPTLHRGQFRACCTSSYHSTNKAIRCVILPSSVIVQDRLTAPLTASLRVKTRSDQDPYDITGHSRHSASRVRTRVARDACTYTYTYTPITYPYRVYVFSLYTRKSSKRELERR